LKAYSPGIEKIPALQTGYAFLLYYIAIRNYIGPGRGRNKAAIPKYSYGRPLIVAPMDETGGKMAAIKLPPGKNVAGYDVSNTRRKSPVAAQWIYIS